MKSVARRTAKAPHRHGSKTLADYVVAEQDADGNWWHQASAVTGGDGRTELQLPAVWAERLDVTNLVPDEWRDGRAKVSRVCRQVADDHRARVTLDGDIWAEPISDMEFRNALFTDLGFRTPRSKKLRPFKPTADQIKALLAEAAMWISTSEITQRLAIPLGYTGEHLPANTKTTTVLRSLETDGAVVLLNSSIRHGRLAHDRRHPHSKNHSSNGNYWALTADIERWDAALAELDTRTATRELLIDTFAAEHQLATPTFKHDQRNGDSVIISYEEFRTIITKLEGTA